MLANFLYQELLSNEIDKPNQFVLNFANIIQYTFVGLLLLKLHKPIIIINKLFKISKIYWRLTKPLLHQLQFGHEILRILSKVLVELKIINERT